MPGKATVIAKAEATIIAEVTAEVDVRAVRPDDYPRDERDCMTSWFWEWDLDLFGWNLGVAVDIEPRPARWGLYAQWLRCRRASLFDWLGSFASLTLCLGPVAVSVSALRITAKVLRAWDVCNKVTAPTAPEPESPLAGVRCAIYFDAE